MKGRGVPDTPARKTAANVGVAATVAANKKSPTEAKQLGGSGGRRKLGQPVKVDALSHAVGLTPDSTHAHEDTSSKQPAKPGRQGECAGPSRVRRQNEPVSGGRVVSLTPGTALSRPRRPSRSSKVRPRRWPSSLKEDLTLRPATPGPGVVPRRSPRFL